MGWIVALLLAACEGQRAAPAPASRPVSTAAPGSGELVVVQRQPPELKLISEPVGATELVSALPALKALSPTALAVV